MTGLQKGLVAIVVVAVLAFLQLRPGPGGVIESVAVLPFTNMSPDPEQEYFADGLADELTTRIGAIRDLWVAARTSAFSFKGKDVKIADVAAELNVAHVLEGSVRKA